MAAYISASYLWQTTLNLSTKIHVRLFQKFSQQKLHKHGNSDSRNTTNSRSIHTSVYSTTARSLRSNYNFKIMPKLSLRNLHIHSTSTLTQMFAFPSASFIHLVFIKLRIFSPSNYRIKFTRSFELLRQSARKNIDQKRNRVTTFSQGNAKLIPRLVNDHIPQFASSTIYPRRDISKNCQKTFKT